MKPQQTPVRPHVRWAIRRDTEEILQIDQASKEPWSEGDFLRVMRRRNCISMVGEQGEKVVGFVTYELRKTRIQVLKFAVHPDHGNDGIGLALVEKLKSKLSSERRTKIVIEVQESSLASCLFFRSQGFEATQVLCGHYDDGEDAYVMEYRLPGTSEGYTPVNRISQYEAD